MIKEIIVCRECVEEFRQGHLINCPRCNSRNLRPKYRSGQVRVPRGHKTVPQVRPGSRERD